MWHHFSSFASRFKIWCSLPILAKEMMSATPRGLNRSVSHAPSSPAAGSVGTGRMLASPSATSGSGTTIRRRLKEPTVVQSAREQQLMQQFARWAVDDNGNIVNFDMRRLREDTLLRLKHETNLYTLSEVRAFLAEIAKISASWQERELAQVIYLAELHHKLFPERPIAYQFPPASVPMVPFASSDAQVNSGGSIGEQKVLKLVEELNRSLVRVIDQVWNDRRERLLLAARLLEDLEQTPQLE